MQRIRILSLLVASLLVLLLISAASVIEPASRANKIKFVDLDTELPGERSERNKSVYNTLKSLDEASIFFRVAHKMGLDSVLKADGPLTVFVPSNEVLDPLLNEVQLALLIKQGREDEVRKLLLHHISPTLIRTEMASEHADQPFVQPSLAKDYLGIGISAEGAFFVNKAMIIRPDIACSNGMIHILNQVIETH